MKTPFIPKDRLLGRPKSGKGEKSVFQTSQGIREKGGARNLRGFHANSTH